MKPTNEPVMDITSLKFAEFLQEGLPFVDQRTSTDINSGGCGYFADMLANELDEHKVPYQIFGLFTKSELIEDKEDKDLNNLLKRTLKKFQKDGTISEKMGVAHVVLCVEDTLFVDSSGIINLEVLDRHDRVELSRKDLKGLLPLNVWNDVFDVDCIPQIQTNLDNMFKHFDDFKMGIFKYPRQGDMQYTDATMRAKRKRNGGGSRLENLIRMMR
jgi:hypothetical protein